jgi:hypothetical protein
MLDSKRTLDRQMTSLCTLLSGAPARLTPAMLFTGGLVSLRNRLRVQHKLSDFLLDQYSKAFKRGQLDQ